MYAVIRWTLSRLWREPPAEDYQLDDFETWSGGMRRINSYASAMAGFAMGHYYAAAEAIDNLRVRSDTRGNTTEVTVGQESANPEVEQQQ